MLALLLTASLAGALGLFVAQSTVLDAEYVTDTMAEQGVYAELEGAAEDAVMEQAQGSMVNVDVFPNADGLVNGAVQETVTTEYVEGEVRTNVENLYAYLHGETAPLQLVIDPSPLVDGISGAIASQIENMPVADILQQPGLGDSFSGLGVNTTRVGDALEDEQTFTEMQANMSQRADRLGATTDELNQSVREQASLGEVPQDVEESVYRLQGTIVLGLTSDMSYETFTSKLEAGRSEFATAIGAYAQQQVQSELDGKIDLTEQLGPDAREQIDRGADSVQLVDTLTTLLPILAFILLLGILVVSHSISRTARTLGVSLVTVGVLGLLAGLVGGNVATDAVANALSGGEEFVRTTAVAMVDGLFATYTQQSILFLLAGIAFVGLWFAIRRYEPAQVPDDWR